MAAGRSPRRTDGARDANHCERRCTAAIGWMLRADARRRTKRWRRATIKAGVSTTLEFFTRASKFGHRRSQTQPWSRGNSQRNLTRLPGSCSCAGLLLAAISASPLVMFSLVGLGGAQPAERRSRFRSDRAREPRGLFHPRQIGAGQGAAHARRGDGQGRRAGARDQQRQSARDRESRRRGGVRPVRRHREGRQAGSHADGEPGAAAEIGPHPDRVVLRRGGPLVGARPRGCEDISRPRRPRCRRAR